MDEMRGSFFTDDTPDLPDGPELVPLGPHLFEVVDVRTGTASSGRGRLGIFAEVVGDDDPGKGRKAWDNWNLPIPEDKPDHRFRRFWKRVAGICPAAFRKLANGEQALAAEALKGLRFRATTIHEEYDGKLRAKFDFSTPESMNAAAGGPTAAGASKMGRPSAFSDPEA